MLNPKSSKVHHTIIRSSLNEKGEIIRDDFDFGNVMDVMAKDGGAKNSSPE